MIDLILRSYFAEIFSITSCAILIFLLGSLFILRWQLSNNKKLILANTAFISAEDFDAIAGDDVLATQLDLARAYLETDRQQLAKEILLLVMNEGSSIQRQEAQQLLSTF